jgi:myo-inositol 2-dehydrogenase/D-chiro-inositol 1-dehydrogenase
MGANHVETLIGDVAGAEVVAVADADEARARSVAASAGDCQVREAEDLIRDSNVDAVLIASSEETHEELVLACIEASKPVLCEKPLAPTADACLRVVEAESSGIRPLVQVGFNRRFDPSYIEMKRMLDAGDVGNALFLHCVHRNLDYPPFYDSDALINATAVHDIDIARWLLGEEMVSVTVHTPRASSLVREGFQDPQFLLLESERGTLVDVEVFVNAHYGYDVRCELVGEQGTISLLPPATVSSRRAGVDGHAVAPDFRPRFATSYRSELQAWVAATAVGEVCGATAWDGYAAGAVAQAGLESLETGSKTTVRLASGPARPVHDRSQPRDGRARVLR